MGLPRAEAAARLRAGDVSFVLEAEPKRLPELASYAPDAPFFAALRAESLGADPSVLGDLYALSWTKAGGPARREAGRRLVELGLGRPEAPEAERDRLLSAARRYRSDYPDDPDARARLAEALLAAGKSAEVRALFSADSPALTERERSAELLAAAAAASPDARQLAVRFFLESPSGPEYGRAHAALAGLFPDVPAELELAARARSAVFRRSYGEAAALFGRLAADGPRLLLSYPELLGDAGRAFQYGGDPEGGAARFEAWARLAADDDARFRLLFFAGRMLRQAEQTERANLLFAEALPLAPDAAQRDACLWYALDGAASLSPVSAVPLLRKYAPLWKSSAFFADFLDRLCGLLVAGGFWGELLETFRIVRPAADEATEARYAYVIGRAVSLGYIGADRPVELLSSFGDQSRADPAGRASIARAFFRIAFESDSASFYYRCLAASRLGENLDPVPAEERLNRFGEENSASGPETVPVSANGGESSGGRDPETLGFLLSFFEYGLADRVAAFAQPAAAGLGEAELRTLAARLAEAGRTGDSIRLMGGLAARPGYRLTRRDLELLYPRAFGSEIRDAAGRWGVPEEQLFGLVRTESAFIPDAVSRAGAEGLAQLMAPTAKDVAARIGRKAELKYAGELPDLSDPATNLHLGAWYLASLNERLKSPLLALFSYNGGITRVRRWRAAESALPEDLFLETVPIRETRDYARKVLAAASVYGYLYLGKPLSRVVADIFPEDSGR